MKKENAHKEKSSETINAIELLETDHKKVKKLFKDYEKIEDGEDDEKMEMVTNICRELILHSQIEEEIFYPAVRDAIDEEDLVDEAIVEHAAAKQLIDELQGMDASDDLYDAKVTVLCEEIEHHVEEEEKKMFPKVKKAKMDIESLGMQMRDRKQVLMKENGMSLS